MSLASVLFKARPLSQRLFTTTINKPSFSFYQFSRAMSTIKVGDTVPEATFYSLEEGKGVQTIKSSEFFSGKKVVVFSVPGAFTPSKS